MKHLIRLMTLIGILAMEIAFVTGFFLLLALITLGLMAGCKTLPEIIHIFF